jgi:hypothetical protein
VNAVLLTEAPDSSGQTSGGVDGTPRAGFPDSAGTEGMLPGSADQAPRPGSRLDPNRSGFLGVAERGMPLLRPDDASLEAWKRLRGTLADEIVATATEITLRVRGSS